jgi:hypothetical protein
LLILSCLHHQWSLSWFPFLKSMLFTLVFVAFQHVSWKVGVSSPSLESTIVSCLKGLGLPVLQLTTSTLYPLYKTYNLSFFVVWLLPFCLHIYDTYLSQMYIRMYLHGISKMQVWWFLHYGNILEKCASSSMCVNEMKGYNKSNRMSL